MACPTRGRVLGQPAAALAAGHHLPMGWCWMLLLLVLGLAQRGDGMVTKF